MFRALLVLGCILVPLSATAGSRTSVQEQVVAKVGQVVARERALYVGLSGIATERAPNFPCNKTAALAQEHEIGLTVFEQLHRSNELAPRWRKKLGKHLDDARIYLRGIDGHLVRLGCRQTA